MSLKKVNKHGFELINITPSLSTDSSMISLLGRNWTENDGNLHNSCTFFSVLIQFNKDDYILCKYKDKRTFILIWTYNDKSAACSLLKILSGITVNCYNGLFLSPLNYTTVKHYTKHYTCVPVNFPKHDPHVSCM